jgi:hypothetical protein
MVEALAALVHIHRDVNAANHWALLGDASVRIAPAADNSVLVCGSEGPQRSVDRCEMLTQTLVSSYGIEWHVCRGREEYA